MFLINLKMNQENTQGPVYYDAGTDFMNKLATGDYFGALADIASGNVSLKEAGQTIKNHTLGALAQGLTGRGNRGLQSSKVAMTIVAII